MDADRPAEDPAARAVPATRRATAADTDALVEVLGRAFDDDPVACFLFPSDGRRRRALRRFFRIQLRHMYLTRGEVWTTLDLSGAALWGTPETGRPGPRELWHLAPMLPDLLALGRSVPDAARLLSTVDRLRPRQAHWYLATLGTDPPRQGSGVGSALLGRVLDQLDEAGLPAYLESSKERNLAFYARHGFEVGRELQVARDAPRLWTMWRTPRPPAI